MAVWQGWVRYGRVLVEVARAGVGRAVGEDDDHLLDSGPAILGELGVGRVERGCIRGLTVGLDTVDRLHQLRVLVEGDVALVHGAVGVVERHEHVGGVDVVVVRAVGRGLGAGGAGVRGRRQNRQADVVEAGVHGAEEGRDASLGVVQLLALHRSGAVEHDHDVQWLATTWRACLGVHGDGDGVDSDHAQECGRNGCALGHLHGVGRITKLGGGDAVGDARDGDVAGAAHRVLATALGTECLHSGVGVAGVGKRVGARSGGRVGRGLQAGLDPVGVADVEHHAAHDEQKQHEHHDQWKCLTFGVAKTGVLSVHQFSSRKKPRIEPVVGSCPTRPQVECPMNGSR